MPSTHKMSNLPHSCARSWPRWDSTGWCVDCSVQPMRVQCSHLFPRQHKSCCCRPHSLGVSALCSLLASLSTCSSWDHSVQLWTDQQTRAEVPEARYEEPELIIFNSINVNGVAKVKYHKLKRSQKTGKALVIIIKAKL